MKTVSCEKNLRVTYDDSNDVKRGLGFEIIDAGSLVRNSVAPPSVLFELLFLLVRV